MLDVSCAPIRALWPLRSGSVKTSSAAARENADVMPSASPMPTPAAASRPRRSRTARPRRPCGRRCSSCPARSRGPPSERARREAAEHAEVAVPEVAEQRAEHQQHHRAARHLAVDRHDRGRAQHEQDERPPAAEPVGDEAERQVAEIRADLHRDDPPQRADDAHAGAALLDGARQKRRQPEEDAPVRELHGAAEQR